MNCAFTFKQVSKEQQQQQQQLSNQQTDVSALASDDRRYTASNGRCFNLVDKDLSSATSPLSTIHSAAPGIGVGDDDGIGVNGEFAWYSHNHNHIHQQNHINHTNHIHKHTVKVVESNESFEEVIRI